MIAGIYGRKENMSENYSEHFNEIVDKAKAAGTPMRTVIAGADVDNILQGALDAQEDGFIEPILVGNYKKIMDTLERLGYTDRKFDIQPVSYDINVVQYAIEMVRAGNADALLRGNTQTRDFLLPILNKANHLLKKDSLVTHVVLMGVPDYDRLLAVSDVTLLINPTLKEKEGVIRNMVSALNMFGIDKPNVALLSLVEKPSFHMKDTVEAQTLVMEHNESPIANCNLAGPIAYDLIMSKKAAELKDYECPYCGEFDGIVVSSLISGNLMVKVLETNGGATGCGILMGSNIPIAITSRSDKKEETYLSLAACAAMFNSPNKKAYYGE
ncbi:MAG: hypothetical protein K5989_04230 [Lachnospiraceae bacterium]|nr:hypothetical protein [Lachnospiraceae bacterium]